MRIHLPFIFADFIPKHSFQRNKVDQYLLNHSLIIRIFKTKPKMIICRLVLIPEKPQSSFIKVISCLKLNPHVIEPNLVLLLHPRVNVKLAVSKSSRLVKNVQLVIYHIKSCQFSRIRMWLLVSGGIPKNLIKSSRNLIYWNLVSILLKLLCKQRISKPWLNFEHFAEFVYHRNGPTSFKQVRVSKETGVGLKGVVKADEGEVLVPFFELDEINKEIWGKVDEVVSLIFINSRGNIPDF